MFRALFYPSNVQLYADNVRASGKNSMSGHSFDINLQNKSVF